MIKHETWINLKDFPVYMISNLGRVKHVYKNGGKILSTFICKNGYEQVTLSHKGKSVGRTIHRLMAIAFIPNPHNKPQINHIDGCKTNNKLSNLEWCTRSENMHHAWINGLYVDSDKRKNAAAIATRLSMSKAVKQLTLEGELIKEWFSATDAANFYKLNRANITSCCTGNRNLVGGYKWSY